MTLKPKISITLQWPVILGLLFCSALLILAVPRFIGSLYALYPDAVYQDSQNTLTSEIYQQGIDDLNLALSWYNNPDDWKKQSYFYLMLHKNQNFLIQSQNQTLLKQAQIAMINGLTLSPIDPYGWLQLAEIDELLKMPHQQVINDLRLSFYAGRVEPDLVISRLMFSYKYYDSFSADMQSLWQKQILIAWAVKAPQLLQFIARFPDAKAIALTAFTNSPDEGAKFLSQLTQLK